MKAQPGELVRYDDRERMSHWLTALLLLAAAASGLAFFHPSFYFLTHLFGGGSWTRILHPFIGVATADLFPKFTLTGTAGVQSLSTGDLLGSGSEFWTAGPAFTWRLFDGADNLDGADFRRTGQRAHRHRRRERVQRIELRLQHAIHARHQVHDPGIALNSQ